MAGLLDFLTGGLLGGQAPQQQPPAPFQGGNDPFGAAFQNLAHGKTLIGGLADAFQGAATGQRTDPVGMYQQMAGMTYKALLDAGVPEPQARLGATNPDVQKAITAKMFPQYAAHNIENTVGKFNPATGDFTPQYTAPRPQTSVTVGNTATAFNPNTGQYGQSYTPPPVYSAHNVGNTAGGFNPQTGQFTPQYVAPELKTVAPGDTGISYQPPLGGPVQSAPLPPVAQESGPLGRPPPAPVGQGGTQVIVPGMSLQEKEAATERGKLQGQAQGNLPKAEATASQALSIIDQIQTHPGRNAFSTGPLAGTAQYQKGTPQYDFSRLVEQAKSGAFLSAFATLRGGGSISDAEGRKATDALARMDPAQTKEGFNKALNDYRSVIQTGLANQQKIARGEMQPYPTTPIEPKTQSSTAPTPPTGFKLAPDGKYYSEKPGASGKYQIWTPG